ncbi:MAG: hypothetical protein JNJ86_02675 [Chitinophagaceae bacterium]|nr:hypothetical protein [Chitinophagaceae bacterium]
MATILSTTQEKEIKELLIKEFGTEEPTEEQIADYVEKTKLPRNDGGLSIIIAAAAFLLQGWSALREEQKRRKEKNQPPSPPPPPKDSTPEPMPPNCPLTDCSLPAADYNFETKEYKCPKGHKWKER